MKFFRSASSNFMSWRNAARVIASHAIAVGIWGIGLFVPVIVPFGVLSAQTPVLKLGTIEVLPGQEDAPMPIYLSTDDAVNAVTMRIRCDTSTEKLRDVTLNGGVLQSRVFDFVSVEVFANASGVTIEWTLDSTPAYTNEIPVGDNQILGYLLFDIETLLLPGNESEIEFQDVATSSIKNRVFIEGDETVPELVNGSIVVSEENFFIMEDDHARRTQEDQRLPVKGYNVQGAQGYSIAIDYDALVFDVNDVKIDDKLVQSVNPEFIETIIDDDEGTVIIGVLFDLLPPFDDHTLPAAGIVYELARLIYDVYEDAPLGISLVEFTDGIGSPPIDNIYVIDNQSVSPNLVNAVFEILEPPIFVRGDVTGNGTLNIQDPILSLSIQLLDGFEVPDCQKAMDANDDGLVNVADPIYTLYYLFQEGPEPPDPFPEPGLDPTPDEIPCD